MDLAGAMWAEGGGVQYCIMFLSKGRWECFFSYVGFLFPYMKQKITNETNPPHPLNNGFLMH